MQYTANCRLALETIRASRDRDRHVWFPMLLAALSDLLPGPAISHALADPTVWNPDLKRHVRNAVSTGDPMKVLGGMQGVDYDGLVQSMEELAEKDRSKIVRERHLAQALGVHANALKALGVNPERLIQVTTLREGSQAPEDAVRIAALHPSGETQERLVADAAAELRLEGLIALDERGGRVDWKRSIYNTAKTADRKLDRAAQDAILNSQETAAVALINGNPEIPVYLAFGVEDDKVVVGQVSQDGHPISDQQVRECQRRFDQRMQRTVPPQTLRWIHLPHPDGEIVVAVMNGRRRGTGVRTSFGTWPLRSGEDTYDADLATLSSWVAEQDPRLRQVLEIRAANDERLAGLLEEMVKGQRQQELRQRDALFPRLNVVGSSLQGDGHGSITVKHIAGVEPSMSIEVWLFRNGILSAGRHEGISSQHQDDVVLAPTRGDMTNTPLAQWKSSDLMPGEYLMALRWEGLQRGGHYGLRVWKFGSDGNQRRELVNDWDQPND